MTRYEALLWLAFVVLCMVTGAAAQGASPGPTSSPQQPASPTPAIKPVECVSPPSGERLQCVADTSQGVALLRSTGTGECMLGRTWGYDQVSVWVSDGCGGLFLVGSAVPGTVQAAPPPTAPAIR